MRYNMHRLAFEIGCVLIAGGAIGLSCPAFAGNVPATQPNEGSHGQDTQQTAKPATATNRDGSQQSDDEKQSTQLATVVVTAQSRKQRLEEVPIAVQVINAQDIQVHAATDLSKMDEFIPGLKISAGQPTQPTYQLRGIGGSGFGIGTDPAVGVYIDGVYSARSGAALLAFNDVKRVEVLKGPQGTLFGRNAAAGAISIITNRPTPDRVEARARMRLGNYGERYGNVLLNLPAGSDMAFRLSAYDNQSDGWVTNQTNGQHYGRNDDWGARVSWLLNTDETQYWLTIDHERLNQPPEPHFGLIALSGDTHQRAPFPPDPDTYLNPLHAPLYNDAVGAGETRRYDDATLHIDHFTGWGTFTSITSWRQFNTYNRGDWDGTDHIVSYIDETNVESNRSLYQEFKLSGSNPLVNWVAGVSWYKEDGRQHNQVNLYTDTIDTLLLNLGVPTGTPDGTLYHYFTVALQASGLPISLLGDPWREDMVNHLRDTSTAVYGDVIWHLGDHFDLTTGARYTRDIKHFTWYNTPRIATQLDQTIDALAALGVLAQAGVSPATFRQNLEFTQSIGVPFTRSHDWSDFSPRVVLTDHFTSNLMGYVSVAKGYKAGGFNSLKVNSMFEPEKVWNYEAGFKGVFPRAHLVLNTSVYHYRYSNLQQLTLQTQTQSGIPRYLTESSNEKATGVDLEMQWKPTGAFLVNFSAAYIDSTYGQKTSLSGQDLSGQPTGIPRFSAALGLQYIWHVGGGQLTLNAEQGYRSARRCNDISQAQGTCQISPNFKISQATTRTDLRLGWTAPRKHWGVALYANNLFNKRYVIGVNNTATNILGTPFASITPPRTYGLELRVKY